MRISTRRGAIDAMVQRTLSVFLVLVSVAGCTAEGASDTPGQVGDEEAGQLENALGLPEPGEITVVAMPDIQWYSLAPETILDDGPDGRLRGFLGHFNDDVYAPDILRQMHRWILQERVPQRIAFVTFLGDLVERGRDEGSRPRWEVTRESIDVLHGQIPYGLAVGNHDMVTGTGDTSLFEEFFGAERFEDFDWYYDSHRNNVNSAQRLEVDGVSLLFVHLTCNAPAEDLDWVADLLGRYPDDHVFVSTHMLLGPVGRDEGASGRADDTTPVGLMEWTKCYGERGIDARSAWDRLFSRHGNVVAVLSGDQSSYQAAHESLVGHEQNRVHLMMSDYKQVSSDGYLRVLRYHPETRRLRVMTYSPILDQLLSTTAILPDPSHHNFELGAAASATTMELGPESPSPFAAGES